MSSIIFPTTTTTLLVNTLSANKIVYLPPISTVNAGSLYFIKDICGNSAVSSIYIYAAGSDTIERQNAGSASALLNANFGSALLVPDGISNWMVLQHYNSGDVVKRWTTGPTSLTSVNLTFVVGNTYILATWSQVNLVVSYTASFYSNATNSTINGTLLQTITNITTPYVVSTSALTANTYYYAIITATNTAGSNSIISTTVYTTNLPPVPLMVSISSSFPLLTCTWYASLTATTYNVIFYQNTSQTTVGATTFQTFNGVSALTQTTSSSPTTTNGYYYYATVVAVNGALLSTPVAQSAIIIVTTAPGAVSNVSFSFVYPNFLVTWSASTQTSTYTIVFYQLSTPANTGGASFQTFTGVTNTTQTSSTIATLNYYCYAIITSVNPYTGATTSVSSSYVQATLAPTVTGVSVSLVYPNLLVIWTSIQASSYTVYFYSSGGSLLETDTPATTSQTSAFTLTDGASYYVTVRATNPYTNTSVTTSPQQISLQPTINSVTMSFSGNQATATWTTTSGTSFTVTFYENSSNSTTGGTQKEIATSVTGTSRATTTTLTNGLYYYATVQAFNANGQSSIVLSSSAIQAAILPTGGAITLNSDLTVNSGSVTITSAASLATGYTVYISTSTSPTGFNFTTTIVGSSVPFTISTTPLTGGATYYAVLVPYNTYGNSISSVSSSGVNTVLYNFTGTLTFTPGGATGANGPTLSQCKTAYSSFGSWINNTSYYNITTQGIQQWTVPATRNYTIVCASPGYSGYASQPGITSKGVIYTATFSLTLGQVINIIVGQLGVSDNLTFPCYGGAGGTFVLTSTNTPLIVAGGAGGASWNYSAGRDGNPSTSGTAGDSAPSYNGAGGTSVYAGGSGGTSGGAGNQGTGSFDSGTSYPGGGGGSGITGLTNGIGNPTTSGIGLPNVGGFGGGGGGGYHGGGGGGGYSGGGGGSGGYLNPNGNPPSYSGGGGGGGSYCSVTLTSSSVTNTGQGYVSIT